MIITVSGSAGTGKSVIAKSLSKRLNLKYLDVNKLIRDKKLYSSYDKNLDTYEVDVRKLNKFLVKEVKGRKLILDSHLSHYLDKKYVDYCVICKCDIKELKKRLEIRKYNRNKIRENLDSEIFDICLVEALERKHNVIVVDTTKKRVSECVKEVLVKLGSKSSAS